MNGRRRERVGVGVLLHLDAAYLWQLISMERLYMECVQE